MSAINPVGPTPSAAACLLGALLWSDAGTTDVLDLIREDDIDPAEAAILAAVRRLATADRSHGPQLVADELRRVGELKSLVAEKLRAAMTSGADGTAVRQYAAAVVADALRRRVESAGDSLTSAAWSTPEDALVEMVARSASGVADCASRLARLRGHADEL